MKSNLSKKILQVRYNEKMFMMGVEQQDTQFRKINIPDDSPHRLGLELSVHFLPTSSLSMSFRRTCL